jgi:serine/threonine-protein kinase
VVRIAPDGSRAVAGRASADRSTSDIWMVDTNGNAAQFTTGEAHKGSPVWSPDGSRIAYYSELSGNYDIVSSPAKPGAKVDLLLKSADAKYPTDWSHDGKLLLFGVATESTRGDIWAMSLPDKHAGPVLDTIYSESFAALSPDGKWLAFQSDETSRNQIYVQPFDGITRGTRRRYDVSTEAGGGLPRWSADGTELFYLTNNGRMMSAKVHPVGDEFQNDPPQMLFQTRTTPGTWNYYDVAPDGQKFLLNLPLEWPGSSPITVVTNWTEKVKD